MITYIKRNAAGYYITLAEALDPKLYNNIGSTYEDFLNNKFILLTEDLIKFHNDNPTASVKEVWDMLLEVDTLDNIKNKKIEEINNYDSSESVNQFFYNNNPYWLDKATRVGLMNSTTILKNNGEEYTTLWLNNESFTLLCETVIKMLSALEIYALNCYNITAEHKAKINAMTSKEEIIAFDITADYPEKLNFN